MTSTLPSRLALLAVTCLFVACRSAEAPPEGLHAEHETPAAAKHAEAAGPSEDALARLAALGYTGADDEPALAVDPWSPAFVPPAGFDTGRVHLEPLGARHAQLDYDALMGSREHLQATLGWGSWPTPDFTVEQNRKDLMRHDKEFMERKGYAYTVQTPDGSRCVGCVYMNPPRGEVDGPGMSLAYWVTEPELDTDLDVHLLESVLAWVERDWPFDTVQLATHVQNERGLAIALDLGLEDRGQANETHRLHVWHRE